MELAQLTNKDCATVAGHHVIGDNHAETLAGTRFSQLGQGLFGSGSAGYRKAGITQDGFTDGQLRRVVDNKQDFEHAEFVSG